MNISVEKARATIIKETMDVREGAENIKKLAEYYLMRLRETLPEAVGEKINRFLEYCKFRGFQLDENEKEALKLVVYSHAMTEITKKSEAAADFLCEATKADTSPDNAPIMGVLTKLILAQGDSIEIPEPLKTKIGSALKKLLTKKEFISEFFATRHRQRHLYKFFENYPNLSRDMLRDTAIMPDLLANDALPFIAHLQSPTLLELLKKTKNKQDRVRILTSALLNDHQSFLEFLRNNEEAEDEILKDADLCRKIIEIYGINILANAFINTRFVSSLITDPRLRDVFISSRQLQLNLLEFSNLYPGAINEFLRNLNPEECFRKFPHEEEGRAKEVVGVLLLRSTNYPNAMINILRNPQMSQWIIRENPESVIRYCEKYPEFVPELKKIWSTSGFYGKKLSVELKLQQKECLPTQDLQKDTLLLDGIGVQNKANSSEDFSKLWSFVEEEFGIKVNPRADVSFGLEVEPESGKRILEDLNELRTFSVSEPSDVPVLIKAIADYLPRHFPDAAGGHGAILGTLHFNIALTAEEYERVVPLMSALERMAGVFIAATSPGPKIATGLTERTHLKPDGSAWINAKKGCQKLSAGPIKQTVRLEIKGFGIPQDQHMEHNLCAVLELLARVVKEPGKLASWNVNKQMDQLQKGIFALALDARKQEDILSGGYSEETKEDFPGLLTPENRKLSEYKELVAGLMKKLEALKKEVEGRIMGKEQSLRAGFRAQEGLLLTELRTREAALSGHISEKLMAEYRAGKDISGIVKNLDDPGLNLLWGKIETVKSAIANDRDELEKDLLDMQKSADAKWLEEIKRIISHSREAINHVAQMRKSIVQKRKQLENLQTELFAALMAQLA